jgi:hypothetical protein
MVRAPARCCLLLIPPILALAAGPARSDAAPTRAVVDAWNDEERLQEIGATSSDPQEQIAALKRLVELEPKNADAAFELGMVIFSLGDIGGGARAMANAISASDDMALIHTQRLLNELSDVGCPVEDSGELQDEAAVVFLHSSDGGAAVEAFKKRLRAAIDRLQCSSRREATSKPR